MGRGKLEIKRIENSTNRQVTYSKRKNGIIKKATEISVLCDAHVSLVIFANNGKMHAYHTPSSSVEDILDKYQNISGKRLWDAKHENLSNEIDRIKKENENMQVELRHLKGEDIASLSFPELQQLEDALTNGYSSIRDKKNEIHHRLQTKTRMLEEEQNELTYVWNTQYNKNEIMDGNVGELGNGIHVCHDPEGRDYHNFHQIPFEFRVQPMQPNLQERL